MSIVLFSLLMLTASDDARMLPVIPEVPAPWAEQGNRHARRRDAKLRRQA